MNLGFAIKTIRNKLRVQQQQLADRCCISKNSISQIEVGNKNPGKETVSRVCEAFGIEEYLLYLMAIEEKDVAPDKRPIYRYVHSALIDLIVQVSSPDMPPVRKPPPYGGQGDAEHKRVTIARLLQQEQVLQGSVSAA